MAPYLIGFAISVCIFAIISKWPRDHIGFVFWFSIAILIPCTLAGLRAETIGTDVLQYALPLNGLANSSDGFSSFYSSSWFRWGTRASGPYDFEIGYVILVWLSTKTFGSLQALLFCTQLLTIAPIAIAAANRKEDGALPLIMAAYLLLYFNTSLNMMRQWIAMAFIFLALIGVYRSGKGLKGNAKAFAIIVFACLFHTSALLGMILLIMRVFLDKEDGNLGRKGVFVCVGSLAFLMLLGFVVNALSSIGLDYYVRSYIGEQSIQLMPNQILLRLPMLLFSVALLQRPGGKNPQSMFLFCVVFVGIVLSQLLSIGENSGRISLVFDMVGMAVPPLLLNTYKQRDVRRHAVVTILVVYCLAYWVFFYVITGSSETIPYLFFWQ